jgi:chromosome segregation ATPase
MQAFTQLVYFDLPIPVWHIVVYVGCISFLMIQRRFKLAIVTSYVLVLCWLHYIFRANLIFIMNGDNVARTIYYLFGFALVLLSIYALFFLEDEAAEFELEKRKKEIAGLRTKAKEAKTKASDLKTQLKKDQITESAARKKLEAELNAKIDELEYRLKEGEGALEKRHAEIADLQTKADDFEATTSALKAQLQKEQTQESVTKNNLDEELNAKIDRLESQLENSESLLQKRDAEIAELQTKADEFEETTSALKAQLEKEQTQESATKNNLDEELNAKIDKLESQLEKGVSLLEKRDAEIAELQAKAGETDKSASALKAQLEKEQTQESASRKKLAEEFNTKIARREQQLKKVESLLEKRDAEIIGLTTKTHEAEKNASALTAQLEKVQTQESATRNNLEEELNAKIDRLESQLENSQSLLEKRDSEIIGLTTKTHEVEKNASTLKAQLEKEQTQESATRNNLDEELKAKIDSLESQLKNSQSLLEKRNAEIVELQAKADEFKESTSALEAHLKNDQNRESDTRKKLEEEFSTKIEKLESQLEKGVSLLEQRDVEIAELQTKTAEVKETASALKAQLEKEHSQESATRNKLAEDFNAKIARLERQLKEGGNLLEKRNAEIVELTTKTHEAEKNASAVKAQLEKEHTQESASKIKLEEKSDAKIAKLEQQLKEGESLVKKRDAEIAELRAKAPVADKKAAPLKPHLAVNRQGAQATSADDKTEVEEDVRKKLHQFQYAVKYLEDQIKEKDRLLGIMVKKGNQTQGANNKNTVDEEAKKKLQHLEQTVKYFEAQVKEKDGLLSLMAKRNQELADLKSKAEERLDTSEAEINEAQTGKESKEL